MKAKWKVTSQVIGYTKMYAVYRLVDTAETDHSGNREFASEYMSTRAEAEALVEKLNEA